jgi:hypothetical protein
MSTVELTDLCECGHSYGEHSVNGMSRCMTGYRLGAVVDKTCEAKCQAFRKARKRTVRR